MKYPKISKLAKTVIFSKKRVKKIKKKIVKNFSRKKHFKTPPFWTGAALFSAQTYILPYFYDLHENKRLKRGHMVHFYPKKTMRVLDHFFQTPKKQKWPNKKRLFFGPLLGMLGHKSPKTANTPTPKNPLKTAIFDP